MADNKRPPTPVSGVEYNLLPLTPRVVTALIELTRGLVTITNTGLSVVVPPDPSRVYLAFSVPNVGNPSFFQPEGDTSKAAFSVVQPGETVKLTLKDDFLLVTSGWFGVSAVGNTTITVTSQRRTR